MPSHAGGLPAALFAVLACAAGATADDLPPTLPPPSWDGQDTGLDVQLGDNIATAPATETGAVNAVVVDGAGPLPVLDADADMSECARDLLRTRLATTVAGDDILAAMALETELLTLCRERQELVLTLHQVETALAALQQADADEGEAADAIPPLLDQFVEPAIPPVETAEEEPLPPPDEAAPEEEPPPDLAWFSILGVKGALRAGITDGVEVWWVTEGALLPGGVTVASISGSPPAVVVAGDEIRTLPWQRRPGGS